MNFKHFPILKQKRSKLVLSSQASESDSGDRKITFGRGGITNNSNENTKSMELFPVEGLWSSFPQSFTFEPYILIHFRMTIKVYGTIILHSIFFVILLCLFFWQGWKCRDLYQKAETSVQMRIKQAGFTRFPAIAINTGWNTSALGIWRVFRGEIIWMF